MVVISFLYQVKTAAVKVEEEEEEEARGCGGERRTEQEAPSVERNQPEKLQTSNGQNNLFILM